MVVIGLSRRCDKRSPVAFEISSGESEEYKTYDDRLMAQFSIHGPIGRGLHYIVTGEIADGDGRVVPGKLEFREVFDTNEDVDFIGETYKLALSYARKQVCEEGDVLIDYTERAGSMRRRPQRFPLPELEE